MERSHPPSGRSATPADINRNGRPTSIGTGARHQSECPADIIGIRNPLERTLAEQPYFGGVAPTYADYLLFSVFQYARLGCPDEFLAEGTALRRWRDGLALAFDGLGNRYPAYPARLA
jgi:glutathione S-transferase-like protein